VVEDSVTDYHPRPLLNQEGGKGTDTLLENQLSFNSLPRVEELNR
jgi:hypothetical protein